MHAISIYIHWPFCLSKCPYCDFNSHVTTQVDHDTWLKSYKKELDYFTRYIKDKYIKSIFFGGGTPSLMAPATVYGIINKIADIAIIDQNTEITLEANPTSFEVEKFKDFNTAGINRLSIGVQSLREKDLKKLGRNHDANQAITAIIEGSKIFSQISFDLIYAREDQNLQDWQEELKEALKLANGHISLYQLTIEKGTKFYKLFREGKLILPTHNLAADMYEWTLDYLTQNGYGRYEISNYATKGNESKHNLTYWNYESYLGLGPGAHSRVHVIEDSTGLVSNIRALVMHYNPAKWLRSIEEVGHAIWQENHLSSNQIIEEALLVGLRLKNGIDNNRFYLTTKFNIQDVLNHNVVSSFESQGLLTLTKDNLKLTDKGLMLHNYIMPRLRGGVMDIGFNLT